MRILFITRYFPPLEGIASMRLYCWAKYMQQAGHTITVLTSDKTSQTENPLTFDLSSFDVVELPYFDPVLFVCKGKKIGEGRRAGIKAKLACFYRSRMNERIPSRMDFWIRPARQWLQRKAREGESFDAIISSYGPPAAHLVAYQAKKLFGCTWVADFRDLWVDNHHYIGLPFFRTLEAYLERRVGRYADIITTVSEGLKEVLSAKYSQTPVHVIRNGYDPALYTGIEGDYFADAPKKFRLIYTGTIYDGRHDVSPLFTAIRNMREKLAGRFELLFYGSATRHFFSQIKKYEVGEIVQHRGYVSYQDALRLQLSADALLLLEFQHTSIDGVMTGKVFEYLFAPPPVIGLGIDPYSELGRCLRESSAGPLIENNPEAIAQLLSNCLEGDLPPPKNRDAIAQYSRKTQAEQLMELLPKRDYLRRV